METTNESRFERAAIAERLKRAREEIASLAAERQGPPPKLLAVTKTVPLEVINYTIDELGVTAIGENRVQELLEKYEGLHQPPSGEKLEIHLIGSLQTNKVKYIIDKVDMIESVDSLKLAAEIEKQAAKHEKIMDVLVEVNIGREEQKGGIMPEELIPFLREISAFAHLRLRGLMTIAPKCAEKSDYLKYFSEIYRYFIDISQKNVHNICIDSSFDTLSMGMSQSYSEAIRCGSTEIRLGSTLFGQRN